MKKNILTIFFIMFSLAFVFNFFHSKDMLAKYNAGPILSTDCNVITDGYENPSSKLDFNDGKTFEHWEFCIAQDSHQFFSVSNIVSIPIAIVFVFLAFYIRRFDIRLTTKNLILILMSPLVGLFAIGLVSNASLLLGNYRNGNALFDSPKQSMGAINYLLLIGVVFIIATIKIITRLFKKRKQLRK